MDHDWNEVGYRLAYAYGVANPTHDEVMYMATVAQAFSVYRERETEYGALWKESGSEDNAMQIKSKAQRMLGGLTAKVWGDSALDCINYAVFYFLNKKAGR